MFCTRCGTANNNDARFCKTCSAPLTNTAAMVQPVSPGLAAVLSFFFCRLGQIYNGQIFKGILMLITYSISLFLIIAVIGLITTPILWIWGMADAYRTAERLNVTALAGPAL
jgi:TM2 domain-containing membrane protein YozV